MLTDNDIYYFPDKHPGVPTIAIAIGINGKIIIDMPTYVFFYDILKSADSVVANNEDHSNISFIKNENVIETLQTSSFLGSLLASKPDILEIFRPPNQDQYKKNSRVSSGWLYDSEGNFSLPYEGWDTELVDGKYNADNEFRYLSFYTGD
jgi:hypothetical protein